MPGTVTLSNIFIHALLIIQEERNCIEYSIEGILLRLHKLRNCV